jgi:hypothetical protein
MARQSMLIGMEEGRFSGGGVVTKYSGPQIQSARNSTTQFLRFAPVHKYLMDYPMATPGLAQI